MNLNKGFLILAVIGVVIVIVNLYIDYCEWWFWGLYQVCLPDSLGQFISWVLI